MDGSLYLKERSKAPCVINETIIILDFGSQYTQLIARRLREMGVFTEILPPTTPLRELEKKAKGIILSGGPASVYDGSLSCDPVLIHTKLPLLGICYGMQLLNFLHGGTVTPSTKGGEYGQQEISLISPSPLFEGLHSSQIVWMSHGDTIHLLSPTFQPTAQSKKGYVAAIQHRSLPHFGVQFHPEVTHTREGGHILDRFIQICGCARNWNVSSCRESALQEIRNQVGNGRLISLVSGGVDSTVATLLCTEALGADRVFPLHIDSGLMREGESEEVIRLLKAHGMKNLAFLDASHQFLTSLKGISEPEKKRMIIGDLFIRIMEKEMQKLEAEVGKAFLCQGTLYTDLIESGKGVGRHSDLIKSHHNVNPPIVEAKRKEGLIVEPNKWIFKDEVRHLAESLGIPHSLAWRHPFPGPGLAIRILGEITSERLSTLRAADAIFLEEIRKASFYDQIWQAFACLLPINTVGVKGDKRSVGHVIALRAVSSVDGMTADCSILPLPFLNQIATRIINEVPQISRVVYDITSKPPSTIEWE